VLASLRRPTVFAFVAAAILAQQPNRPTSGLIMNYRDGGATWPLDVKTPAGGLILSAVYGPPGVPFGLFLGASLQPSASALPNGDVFDIAAPVVFAQGASPILPAFDPGFVVWPFGTAPTNYWTLGSSMALVAVFVPPGVPLLAPPVQGVVLDPFAPSGYSTTGAIRLDMVAPPGVLFVQGHQNPFGFGPQSRIDDPSFMGYGALKFHLGLAGFAPIHEFIHAPSSRITSATLAPYKTVVLCANRTPFTAAEIGVFDAFVRAGGGLIAMADSAFGIDPVPQGSTNYVTTCDPYVADNAVLAQFGLELMADNYALTTTAYATVDHPVTRALHSGIRGEGLSLVRAISASTDNPIIVAQIPAGPAAAPGTWCPPSTPVLPGEVFGAVGVAEAGSGRVVATFDRNTFLTAPGFGTHLDDASNLIFAMNLFHWASGLN
jgi:hypothetical protein